MQESLKPELTTIIYYPAYRLLEIGIVVTFLMNPPNSSKQRLSVFLARMC